jgi:hypothetical protein
VNRQKRQEGRHKKKKKKKKSKLDKEEVNERYFIDVLWQQETANNSKWDYYVHS